MKRIIPLVIVIAILLSLIVFHWSNINKFPSKIHAWTQSDRYALALGFIENKFDFFHPQTYNLTESPDHNPTPRESSITAVDFPINDFAAALLMKLFGTTDPWCFRLYTLFYSLIGMFFLFLLSKLFIKDNLLSLIVVLFCITSPVYLYYQIGFLPTIPAISNLFIGLYLFFKYQNSKKIWQYSLGIFFITIAVLSRKPFLFFLIALFAYELWETIKSRKMNFRIAITIALSTITILGYFFYNRFLEYKYGNAFLGFILPPNDLAQSFEITLEVLKNWLFQYFTIFHYVAFIVLIIVSTASLYRKKLTQSISNKLLLYCIAFAFVAYAFYYVLMMKQFPAHDYYFLDSFYSVVCLLMIYLTSINFKDFQASNVHWVLSILAFLAFLFIVNRRIQHKREEAGFWDRTEITTNNFDGAETLLNESDIPKSAKILVLDSYTSNIPFIKMKRFGYAFMSQNAEKIKKALTWNFDYVVLQDCYTISDIVRYYPPIMNEIERIAGNGKISIYKKQKSLGKIDALTFLGLSSQKPVLENSIDFDSSPDRCWQNIFSKEIADSTFKKAGVLADSIMFSTTFSLKNTILLTQKPRVLYLSIDVFSVEKLDNSRIAASIDENGQQKYFNTFELTDLVDTLSKWKHLQLVFPILPHLKSEDNELKVYIWNDGRHRFYYDNIHIAVY